MKGFLKWGLGLASDILGEVGEDKAKDIIDAINSAI